MDDWDRTYESIKRLNWTVLLILSSAGYFFLGHTMTLGIILGGFIIIANFGFFQSTVKRSFPSDGMIKINKFLIIIESFIRLLLLGAIIFILITRGLIDPIGLTIGLSTVVLSIVSYGISNAWKSRIGGVS
ncbi:MAG: ATP synthase subunit I [Deltaproteobacteria bacterium]|nr:ATP synthase subunit I [Deltaproteobacteria bacterium]